MRQIVFIGALAGLLAGCSVSSEPIEPSYQYGPGIRPIPGSITYGGQPRNPTRKAPVGSPVDHEFYDQAGNRVFETYLIEPDRSLKLVSRRVCRAPFCNR
ncbi:hypothetical protein KX729_08455 [Rhizobium sp. XQZ8]|uniref:hypothetical protein n=1 Tax=Rhizobium populisoli TaxID=2859785 RepID=UPI001CA5DF2D|nr:hypothetical protein [Rhizobium populisoli]MBW6421471.1 hypothetical protein [Rhizobium populisoli]